MVQVRGSLRKMRNGLSKTFRREAAQAEAESDQTPSKTTKAERERAFQDEMEAMQEAKSPEEVEQAGELVKLQKRKIAGPTPDELRKVQKKRLKAGIKTQKQNVKSAEVDLRTARAECQANVQSARANVIDQRQTLKNLKYQKKQA